MNKQKYTSSGSVGGRINGQKAFPVRESNIELLRILAMLLVVLFHIDLLGMSLDTASADRWQDVSLVGYACLKSLSMPCVNLFVFISGWFGIQFDRRKFLSLCFTVAFFSVSIYFYFVLTASDVTFSPKYFLYTVFGLGYWFVPSYLLLYLFSPVLNRFADVSDRKTFGTTLVGLYLFMFVYGWLFDNHWFDKGCSPLFFFYLYLTARYFHRHPVPLTRLGWQVYAAVFVAVSVVVALLALLLFRSGADLWAWRLFHYNSPFNLLETLSLFFCFTRLHFSSRFINRLASVSFAIYLFHAHPLFFEKVFHPFFYDLFLCASGLAFAGYAVGFVGLMVVGSMAFHLCRFAVWKGWDGCCRFIRGKK